MHSKQIPKLTFYFCCTDEPPMSELGNANGIYSSLSESSPAMGARQGGNNHNSFPLEHGVLPSQDQFHDIRSNSPYGLPQSPGSLQALPRHQPIISSLVYPDSGLSIMTQGSGPGINPAVRVSMGSANGPSSDLSTGSSGGYPDFPASPASWLDEVDHGQFWSVKRFWLCYLLLFVFSWIEELGNSHTGQWPCKAVNCCHWSSVKSDWQIHSIFVISVTAKKKMSLIQSTWPNYYLSVVRLWAKQAICGKKKEKSLTFSKTTISSSRQQTSFVTSQPTDLC